MSTLSRFVTLATVLLAGCGQTPPPKDGGAKKEPGPIEKPREAVDPIKKEEPPAKTDKPDFVLTAKAFLEEHKKDRKSALAKYNGKLVELKGVVSDFSSGDGAGLTLERADDNPLDAVTCGTKDRFPGRLALPGQTVVVRGRASHIAGTGLLKGEVVKVEGAKPPSFTPDLFAAELAAKEEATIAKFKDAYLIMTGEVVGTENNVGTDKDIILKREKPGLRVLARFTGTIGDHMALKAGQKIELIGKIGTPWLTDKQVVLIGASLISPPK